MTQLPKYIAAQKSGLLLKRISQANEILKECTLCPRNCKVNRIKGETGVCKTGRRPVISSYMPHFGEEPPISGINGSGTVFFSHCNLRCCFCQNYDISLLGHGHKADEGQMAAIMILLQQKKCHNINLVTPTHIVPQFLAELAIAVENGLTLPIVYNSSAYENRQTLALLDGIVDIYMPDFKFWDPEVSEKLCNAPDYPETARKAVKEMHRQVGDLETDNLNVARSGLLVRHLVMPEDLAGTRQIMKFLHDQVSPNTHVNVMSQYHPAAGANRIDEISRPVTIEEFHTAVGYAKEYGLKLAR